MSKRSILGSATPIPETAPQPATKPEKSLHIGAYYPRSDPTIIALKKLGVDLVKDQRTMLYEAIQDYVAKHTAARAFLD